MPLKLEARKGFLHQETGFNTSNNDTINFATNTSSKFQADIFGEKHECLQTIKKEIANELSL